MTRILVRDLNPDVVARLEVRARTHGRSLQQEARAILEAAAPLPMEEAYRICHPISRSSRSKSVPNVERICGAKSRWVRSRRVIQRAARSRSGRSLETQCVKTLPAAWCIQGSSGPRFRSARSSGDWHLRRRRGIGKRNTCNRGLVLVGFLDHAPETVGETEGRFA